MLGRWIIKNGYYQDSAHQFTAKSTFVRAFVIWELSLQGFLPIILEIGSVPTCAPPRNSSQTVSDHMGRRQTGQRNADDEETVLKRQDGGRGQKGSSDDRENERHHLVGFQAKSCCGEGLGMAQITTQPQSPQKREGLKTLTRPLPTTPGLSVSIFCPVSHTWMSLFGIFAP